MDSAPGVRLILLSHECASPLVNVLAALATLSTEVSSSFLSVAHVDFCFLFAYIFNLRFLCYTEHGQNLKFPLIQAVRQKLGFGIEREVKNTYLPCQKLGVSWETLSNLSKREGLTLTIFKCSCWQFIFRKPPCVRYMGLTASCR